MTKALLGLLVLLGSLGCASRHAATTWGYSRWYQEFGGASLGAFEDEQRRCLAQVGGDPASIAPDTPEEDRFLQCMNAAGWCTQAFQCEKPGA